MYMELIQDHNIYTRRPIDQVKIKEDSNAPVGLRLIQVNSFPFRTKNDWIARKSVKNILCMDPWILYHEKKCQEYSLYGSLDRFQTGSCELAPSVSSL